MTEIFGISAYAADKWLPAGGGTTLCSALDGSTFAELPRDLPEPAALLHHARDIGGPALRAMTFAERGRLLRGLADALIARKEELYALNYATGATRRDGWLDIEGGAGVLFVYAAKAKALPDRHILTEGDQEALSKGNFAGQHFLTSLQGAAIHINAYNFPVWGMLGKLAPALLAGVPVIVKPASATAWLAYAAFRILVESGLLPDGAVQLLPGQVGDLFDHLGGQDMVSFTGSAETAASLRLHPSIIRKSVRFTSEQDSLNASILGPDAGPGSPEFDLFVREVAREITTKAGQRCTAIRRVLVPAAFADAAGAAIGARLAATVTGDPRTEGVHMGALAGLAQRNDFLGRVERLGSETRPLASGPVGGHAKGAFAAPTLLRCDDPESATLVHTLEAFGPVATLMPYESVEDAAALARRGEGSLALSIFSHDARTTGDLLIAAASSHGRIVIVDRDSGADSTGHGSPMPHMIHGGPGRAGGGEELGGLLGMKHYMQRTAVTAAPATLDAMALL